MTLIPATITPPAQIEARDSVQNSDFFAVIRDDVFRKVLATDTLDYFTSLYAGLTSDYANRAAAQAATVAAAQIYITVQAPDNSRLVYRRDGSGTALTTGDGATWSPAGWGSPYHFGAVLDGDLDAAVTGATNDYTALAAFFAWLSDGTGRIGEWPKGKVARADTRFTGLGGNYTMNWNDGVIDHRNLPNTNGNSGATFTHAGSIAATVAVSNIATSTSDGREIVTVTATAHGLAVGDDFLLHSDDVIDIGHDETNERRGQMCRVRSVTDADTVVIEEPLFETLPTNPKIARITWVDDVTWFGGLTIVGPGRRADSYTDSTEIGYSGPTWTYGRNVKVYGLKTVGIDYQSFTFDNCIDSGIDGFDGRVDPDVPGSVGAIQYGITFKNAVTRCVARNFTTQGYRHAFDHTRNTNPGVARDITVEGFNAVGSWRDAIAMHGNARDSLIRNGTIRNCYDGISVRAPGWRIRDVHFENVRKGISCSDNPAYLDVEGCTAKNVVQAVSFSDANTYIGSVEARDINVRDFTVDGCSGNAFDLDFSTIPVFTEDDSAVTAGTTTSMTVGRLDLLQLTTTGAVGAEQFETLTQAGSGATGYVLNVSGATIIVHRTTGTFNTSGQLTGSSSGALGANSVPTAVTTLDFFNTSGALTGAEITVDPDGGGSAVEVVRIATHTSTGTTNTFTWSSAIGTAPTTSATFKIRTLIEGVNLSDLTVRNGAGRAVQMYGNIRAPRISNVTDNSDTVINADSIWLRSTADHYVRAAEITGLSARNKVSTNGDGVLEGANTLGTRVDGNFKTRAKAVEYIANGGFFRAGEQFTAGALGYLGEDDATDISDMAGVVPLGTTIHPDHFLGAGVTDDEAAQAALVYARSLYTVVGVNRQPAARVEFLPRTYTFEGTVSWPASYENVELIGNGAEIQSAYDGPLFQGGDDDMFTETDPSVGHDVAGTGTHYSSEISGFFFRNTNLTATASRAIVLGKSWDALITKNKFLDFDIAIDLIACGRTNIEGNEILIRGRTTVDSEAGVRIRAAYDSTGSSLGTGIKFFDNNIDGLNDQRDRLKNGVLIHSIDTFYHGDNHYGACENELHINLLGSDNNYANNNCTDVLSQGSSYFDKAGTGAQFRISGNVCYDTVSGNETRSQGKLGSIQFSTTDYFRGDNNAPHAVLVNINDDSAVAGDFVANRGLPPLRVSGRIASHTGVAVNLIGSSGKVPVALSFSNVISKGSNTDSGVTSLVSQQGGSALVTDVMVKPESTTPSRLFTFNGALADAFSVNISGVDAFASTYTESDFVLFSNVAGNSAISVSNCIEKGVIGWDSNCFNGYAIVAGDTAAVARKFAIPGSELTAKFDFNAVCDSTGDGAANRFAWSEDAVLVRRSGASSEIPTGGIVERLRVLSGGWNSADIPACFVLMTGAAWAGTTAIAAREVRTTGGNAYVCVTPGTTGASAPTGTTSAIITDGTVRWAYLGATDANTMAMVFSGRSGMDLRFRGRAEMVVGI